MIIEKFEVVYNKLFIFLLGTFLYIVKMFKDGGDNGMFYFLFFIWNCVELH